MGIISRAWRKALRDAERSSAPRYSGSRSAPSKVFPSDPDKRIADPNLALYVIGFEDPSLRPIKIGVSNNVKKRLVTLQTGCPWRLEIKAARFDSNAFQMEKWLHEHFAEWRIRTDGEWFLPPEGVDPVTWVSEA